ncbi:hypothetical protein B0H13DRAFT_1871212 [Mycena leptocephala]|nr:hypothetical protein B0H13DRAFT_1871212 [Mycena leptocephala]
MARKKTPAVSAAQPQDAAPETDGPGEEQQDGGGDIDMEEGSVSDEAQSEIQRDRRVYASRYGGKGKGKADAQTPGEEEQFVGEDLEDDWENRLDPDDQELLVNMPNAGSSPLSLNRFHTAHDGSSPIPRADKTTPPATSTRTTASPPKIGRASRSHGGTKPPAKKKKANTPRTPRKGASVQPAPQINAEGADQAVAAARPARRRVSFSAGAINSATTSDYDRNWPPIPPSPQASTAAVSPSIADVDDNIEYDAETGKISMDQGYLKRLLQKVASSSAAKNMASLTTSRTTKPKALGLCAWSTRGSARPRSVTVFAAVTRLGDRAGPHARAPTHSNGPRARRMTRPACLHTRAAHVPTRRMLAPQTVMAPFRARVALHGA